MKQIISSFLLALVLTFYVVPIQAQDQTGIANVTVMICDADGNVVAKAKTDNDGRYDIHVTRAHSDYFLQIDEKDRKSKFAIKEQGVKQASMTNDDATSSSKKGYEFYMTVSTAKGYTIKSPRDAASGQASGKRSSGFQLRIRPDYDDDKLIDACAISIDEPGVHVTGQIYGMAINEKGLPGGKSKDTKSTK
jgi:hypothetical protein